MILFYTNSCVYLCTKRIRVSNLDSKHSSNSYTLRCFGSNSITSRNNASISNFGGSFEWKNEYPWYITEVKC
ncbi:Uncharacterized protein FWK35_00021827 [Aphis craccivora]|uniref:Uncharacterized protein n=1 Tax=Aphis craccivora TaxID=307492 RepID=A0A6G0VZQ4_APHCR|nr:Uncharacterized protein FWK35_00021827 [Aphis craccivora]